MKKKNLRGAAVMAGILGVAAAVAQEAAPEAAVPAAFAHTLSVGVTLTDGNSETVQAYGSLVSEGERKGLGSVRLGIEGAYGESTADDVTTKTIENVKAFANVKKTLTERTFGYVDASYLYDDVARVDYRIALSPGLGGYLVKNDRTQLSLEAGPGYVFEKTAGVKDEYPVIRLAQRLDVKLSDTAKLWQAAEYLPEADEFSNYLATVEVGVEAAINTHMSLRLVVQDKYDSRPPDGNEKNDVTAIAGLSVRL